MDNNNLPEPKNIINTHSNVKEGDNPPPVYYTKSEIDALLLNMSPPYLIYKVLLSQLLTSPPVPDILENTLGIEPQWSYLGQGAYQLDLTGVTGIASKKIAVSISGTASAKIYTAYRYDDTKIVVNTTNDSGGLVNGTLTKTKFELLLY